ncbi:MAG: hypothetical protein SGJ24_18645 [Chloroflexota bacterium]|nr:hypothetical protein [Chloroflexota bacterium]
MPSLLITLFGLQYDYNDPVEKQRARALLTMTWIGSLIWLAIYILLILPLILSGGLLTSGYLFIYMTLLPIVLVLIYIAVQQGRLRTAATLFVGNFLALSVPLGLVAYVDIIQLLPVLGLVAAGVLLDRRGLVVVTIICMISIALTTLGYQASVTTLDRFIPAETASNEFIAMSGHVLLIAAFLYAFNGTPERIARETNVIAEQWRAIGVLSARSAVDEASAIDGALRIAQRDLRFNVVQVFLMTDRAGGTRRFRLTENGLLTLDVVPDTVIQEVLTRFEPVIVRGSDRRAADHLVNPALISITLPIQFEGTLLGALDVQSARAIETDAMRLAVLDNLATQLGRGLAQLRRFTALENDVRDQESSAQRLRAQIADLQRRAEGTTTSGWERYLRGFGVAGYGYDMDGAKSGGTLITANDLPPAVRASLERGELHIVRAADHQVISAPIGYRGQMLGAMVFEVPVSRSIGAAEIDLVNTIADRLGNALENNRLFEQNQAQAQRERKANDVGGLLLTATDIEQMLTLAAEAFNEALGATHTRVSVQTEALQRADALVTDQRASNGSGTEKAVGS